MPQQGLSLQNFDYIVVGAGIVGLTLARELARQKRGRILMLEKERETGLHASGRNSGVVHAGIYYASDSLKAKFCVEGARLLNEYAEENRLPLLKCGKVIVATKPETVPTLDTLLERATKNGVEAKRISLEDLRELEPEAKSLSHALWSPRTSVIDSKAVLARLVAELKGLGVQIEFNQQVESVDLAGRRLKTRTHTWNFGFLYNAAGTYADRIAHAFGVGHEYRILPFKGLYWRAQYNYAKKITRLIYPAPNIQMPFLGVHVTRTVDGKVLFGPTAIPAFGRENYSLLGGLDLAETPAIGWNLLKMLIRNPNNMRRYVSEEMSRYRPKNFFFETASMVQNLSPSDIGDFYKVGIRAQLMNTRSGRLEMDFKLEPGPSSLHILNAVSPAFTSAVAFAKHLASNQP